MNSAQTSEPQTEAGRALYEVSEHMTWSNGAAVSNHYMLNTVLAIESEAFMDGARASRENRLAIEAEAAAPTSPDVVEWFVHNHGPSEGKGTACHEYRVNGRLLGECLLRSHEPEPQFVGGRWDCSCGWHAAKANAQIWWDHVAAALPASPDVVSVKKVLDRIVANDLAFGKPLTTEYPSRAMLRNDVKELAALLFGDSFHATDPDAKEAGE
jgi:hypothetical protein